MPDTGMPAELNTEFRQVVQLDTMKTASTAVLTAIRLNLLAGLDLVNQHIEAGTFHTVGPKGSAPPAESGRLTLALLNLVDDELARRNQR